MRAHCSQRTRCYLSIEEARTVLGVEYLSTAFEYTLVVELDVVPVNQVSNSLVDLGVRASGIDRGEPRGNRCEKKK